MVSHPRNRPPYGEVLKFAGKLDDHHLGWSSDLTKRHFGRQQKQQNTIEGQNLNQKKAGTEAIWEELILRCLMTWYTDQICILLISLGVSYCISTGFSSINSFAHGRLVGKYLYWISSVNIKNTTRIIHKKTDRELAESTWEGFLAEFAAVTVDICTRDTCILQPQTLLDGHLKHVVRLYHV